MSNWSQGSTRRWRRTRAFVLLRDRTKGCRAHDEGWCERAGRRTPHTCTRTPTDAHHTLGRALTGDDPRFIVASCHTCNLHIGDPSRGADPPNIGVTQWT